MSDTTNKKRLTLFLNPLLIKHARAQAVIDGSTLTSLIKKALISYLPEEIVIKKSEINLD
jgi:hypothetical protein